MGKATREKFNKAFKDLGKPLAYPNDKVFGEEEVIIKPKKESKK